MPTDYIRDQYSQATKDRLSGRVNSTTIREILKGKYDQKNHPKFSNKAYLSGLAHQILNEKGNLTPTEALLAAELYEKIGKGEKAIPKLKEFVNRVYDKGGTLSNEYQIQNFIKRNTKKSQQSSTLEKTVSAIIAGVGIVGGIIISGTKLTGNVVVGNSTSNSNLLGLAMIIMGLVALVIYSRK